MHVQTKFLWLCKPVLLGDHIDDWRICWLGGWDKRRVFFVVMVERECEEPVELPDPRTESQNQLPSGNSSMALAKALAIVQDAAALPRSFRASVARMPFQRRAQISPQACESASPFLP